MPEAFDSAEVGLVREALRGFELRCEAVIDMLDGKRHLSPGERSEIEALYRTLKDDLKKAAKHGTLSGRRDAKSRVEECFYAPAVSRAAIDLRPPTNSNPIVSGWLSALLAARSEFSYWLHSLNRI